MGQEFYKANEYATEEYNLWAFPHDQFTVVKAQQRHNGTGQTRPWAYVFYKGVQVASMSQDEFYYTFELVSAIRQVPLSKAQPSKRMFHVITKEITENVYNVEASDEMAAIQLATKGRLGVRLKQTLTGFNVMSATDTITQEDF